MILEVVLICRVREWMGESVPQPRLTGEGTQGVELLMPEPLKRQILPGWCEGHQGCCCYNYAEVQQVSLLLAPGKRSHCRCGHCQKTLDLSCYLWLEGCWENSESRRFLLLHFAHIPTSCHGYPLVEPNWKPKRFGEIEFPGLQVFWIIEQRKEERKLGLG